MSFREDVLLDAYIRVSRVRGREGESFLSPSVQRDEIERWAQARGATIDRFYEELDESGAKANRPLLLEAVRRVEERETDGIAVSKLNRFGRSLLDGLAQIARIQAAGGTLISVQQGFDLQTPTGQLIMRFFFALAEWELDQIRENWDIARSRAIERGVYVSARPPPGFRRKKGGPLRPIPKAVPVIVEAFRRRGAGASAQEVADLMNETGPRFAGKPLSAPRVEAMLRNRAYLGEARSGSFSNVEAHEPMVDAATWQLAQRPRTPRRSIKLVLVGLIRCASCGRGMNAVKPESRGSRSPSYYCYGNRARGGCPGPASIRGDEIEPLLEELIFQRAARGGATGTESKVAEHEAAAAVADRDLRGYRDSPGLQRRLGMSSFEAGLEARQRRVEQALLELARARRAAERPANDIYDLEANWTSKKMKERRSAFREFVDDVFIERGRGPAAQRAWVCLRGRGPIETGDPLGPSSFDPEPVGAVRLPSPKRWAVRLIEGELVNFVAKRGTWPDYEQFEDAGYARLHAQVIAWGGPLYWAKRLGLSVDPKSIRWTQERVRGSLRPFLHKRKVWPVAQDFKDAGLEALHGALSRHGGANHWAEEFGLKPLHLGKVRHWTKERVEGGLIELIDSGRQTFPVRSDFERAGKATLYDAARQNGGLLYWSERLGLEQRAPRRKRKARSRVEKTGVSSTPA